MSSINPYIFREYDIRGRVADDFPEHVVNKLGKAFGTFVKRAGGQEIAISGDIRLTTPDLINIFKDGVLSTGVDVINLGILPTPVNYFSMFDKIDFDKGEGTEARYKILKEYNQMIQEKITIEKPMKVVMDCGNAAGAINAPDVFKSLGIELKELFCEPDGTFPNHHPDPTVEDNLKDLIAEMRTGQYDVGIAFDGDADRVGIVDETGDIIWADQLMALFLPEIIDEGEDILFDVKCSLALEDMINRYGGNPIMWKTGHSLIKLKMSELGCKLGGEMSGHIFFADDYYGYDDALYVAARLVQLLSRTDSSLSQLKSQIPVYFSTPEMRLEAENDQVKFHITERAVEYFTEHYDCITVDGVRIKFGDGWGLVRSSNTQPVIVCRFEANSPERREEIMDLVLGKLSEFGKLKIGNH